MISDGHANDSASTPSTCKSSQAPAAYASAHCTIFRCFSRDQSTENSPLTQRTDEDTERAQRKANKSGSFLLRLPLCSFCSPPYLAILHRFPPRHSPDHRAVRVGPAEVPAP